MDNDIPWKRAKEENLNEQEAHEVLTQSRNEGTYLSDYRRERYNEPYRYGDVLMQNPNEGMYAKDYLGVAYCAHGGDDKVVYTGLEILGSAPDC